MAFPEDKFQLILVSALNESGGGLLQRLFDGHPDICVYPFELQLGTGFSQDLLNGYCFKDKYRWPRFKKLDCLSAGEIHQMICDQEIKTYIKHRPTSKFKDFDLVLDIDMWVELFSRTLSKDNRTRAQVVKCYVTSCFEVWENKNNKIFSGKYLGHCPIICVDTDLILQDFQNAKILSLIRNPAATYSDTIRRFPDLSIDEFSHIWNIISSVSYYYSMKYNDNFLIILYEDLILRRKDTLRKICNFIGVNFCEETFVPSWNGIKLKRIAPFGGIPEISVEYERKCKQRLTTAERKMIYSQTKSIWNKIRSI